MAAWICAHLRCSVPGHRSAAAGCPICEDERQYVGWDGQRWTTMAELGGRAASGAARGGARTWSASASSPSFAIGQRALLVRTPHGNVLWDCVSLLDDAGRARIAELGGIDAICMSHPHFYGVNVEFADAFDARIFIPRADAAVDSAALAAHRAVRRRGRAGAGPDPGPDRRALRRRGGAALAGGRRRAAGRC